MIYAGQLSQTWLRRLRPRLFGGVTRMVYDGPNVRIGRNLRCDGIPRCLIDATAELVIEDDVELRSGVELRVHGGARLVIEQGARIDRGARILAANVAEVRIGTGSRIGLYSVLNGGDSIVIGEKVLVSGFVYLQTSMHRHTRKDVAIRDQGYEHGPVRLGPGAWLGAHVVVLPGVTIGEGAIVGSNAVVTRDVDAGETVAGVPARAIVIRDQG